MPGHFLYSANPYFSVEVARTYRNNKTYAWCSEYFSSSDQAIGAPAALIAASSDPKTIYEQLSRACETDDSHDARIKGYRKTFKRLATEWNSNGSLTDAHHAEIHAVCKSPSFKIWRPVLFIIPRPVVSTRLKEVPRNKRASHGMEYTITDLDLSEVDIIELPKLGRG